MRPRRACRDILARNGVSRRALANPWLPSREQNVACWRRPQSGWRPPRIPLRQRDFLDATAHDSFKNVPECVAFSEAAVAVLRKCGMVRDLTFQAEATKPAIGKIEMHFLAQAPF